MLLAFPYSASYSADLGVFSGISNGFFLTAAHGTKNVSNLPYRYYTNSTAKGNTNEFAPIDIVGTTQKAGVNESSPRNNLGNWCIQNYHTMTLNNNTSGAVTVKGYIGANSKGNTHVAARQSTIKGIRLEGNAGDPGVYKLWHWCSISLAPGEAYNFDWQTILASYGAAPTCHIWSLTDPTS